MALLGEFRTLILFTVMASFIECQISKSPGDTSACDGTNVDLDWVYDNAANFATVSWTFINSSLASNTIMQHSLGEASPVVVDNFNVVYKNNGGITLTNVDEKNSGSYKISVTYLSGSPVDDTVSVSVKDCTYECKCKCKRIVISSIVFGSLGMINLPVVIGGTVTEQFGRTTALIVDFIGTVCDVTSFVLGIVMQARDCCEASDCCEDDADCCEDSDCCKDECERNWIENTGAAFIAIGALVGIVAGAIFYLIWSNRMGPGNNGGNGFNSLNGENNGGNNGGRGHGGGHGTDSNTAHSGREDTRLGPLSDTPMPLIPLTDKKGLGLMANNADDHPLIPKRMTGDLMPLEEETKMKEKKAVKDDDDEY